MPVLPLLPCRLADLPGDCSVVIHLRIRNKTGSDLESRLDFTRRFSFSKTGSEFKNTLRDVPESKQSVDEEGMNIEKEKSAYSIHVLKKINHEYLDF